MSGTLLTLDVAAGQSRPWPERSRATAVWLFSVAALVMAMVIVGGATRLTGSGLSITEWKPVSGVVPPLTHAAWADAFDRYRHSSQWRLINQGITLAQFQSLFWWEWGHRLLGRVLGFVFAAPLVALLVTRRLPGRLIGACVGLFLLGGLQGLAGWWMVKSGLEGRAYVAPERLAAHLGLALILFVSLVWTGLEAWSGPRIGVRRDGWGLAGLAAMAAVYLQCLLGALVAGNHAGLIDGDWPLMAGRLFPEGYWRGGLWTTLAHSLPATQFDHRLAAYAVLAGLAVLAGRVLASRTATGPMKTLACLALALGLAQAALGIAALWLSVPLHLALAHQANAIVLLATITSFAWTARRGNILP